MTLTPLSSTIHSDLCLKRGTFFHLQDKPLVSISPVEAPRAALDWPLAFFRNEQGLRLAAILSLDETDNCALGPRGLWMGGYLPAIVRAHPFSMSINQGRATVLVDTDSDWLSTAEGDPLFDPEGNPAEVLSWRVELLKNQAPDPAKDSPVLEAIDQSAVLDPWPEVSENLFRVNNEKLKKLDDQVFLNLRRNRALAAIYAQLISMPRINRVRNLAERKKKMKERMTTTDWKLSDDDIISFGDDDLISFE